MIRQFLDGIWRSNHIEGETLLRQSSEVVMLRFWIFRGEKVLGLEQK